MIDLHCGYLEPGFEAVPGLVELAAEYAREERVALERAAADYAATPTVPSSLVWLMSAERHACTAADIDAALSAVLAEATRGEPVAGARALIEAGRVTRLSRRDEGRSVALFRASLALAPLPEVLPWLVRGAHRLEDDALAQRACHSVWSAAAAEQRYDALDACVRPYDHDVDAALAWAPPRVRAGYVAQRIARVAAAGGGKPAGPRRPTTLTGSCAYTRVVAIGERPGRRVWRLARGEARVVRLRAGERIWVLHPSGYAEAAARVPAEAQLVEIACDRVVAVPTEGR
ncbi:MAG: hypothetical protein V4850_20685 [Myxococcota bacterium]